MKKEKNYFGWFVGLMLIAFLALLSLKCCGVIDLSWIWVTAPLWVLGVLFFAIIVLYCIVISNNWDKSDDDKKNDTE